MNIDFPLILFLLTGVTGLIWLLDSLVLAPRRRQAASEGKKPHHTPMVVEYSRSFFPILLLVFVVRSFLYQPFRVPTGSLEPTVAPGDFILVNMYDYGLRLPILNTKFLNVSQPQRGDIMVFRWPVDTSIDFIKRVIGVPGDRISYINKVLYINGKPSPQKYIDDALDRNDANGPSWKVLKKCEDLTGQSHMIYVRPNKGASGDFYDVVVPKKAYFVMGDNRDNSEDSRVWGFVSEKNIIGKAIMVWMSWDSGQHRIRWRRIGVRL